VVRIKDLRTEVERTDIPLAFTDCASVDQLLYPSSPAEITLQVVEAAVTGGVKDAEGRRLQSSEQQDVQISEMNKFLLRRA
jgi:hypothetical protein